MIISADTNLFLYAANPAAQQHESAQRFFAEGASGKERFLLLRPCPRGTLHAASQSHGL